MAFFTYLQWQADRQKKPQTSQIAPLYAPQPIPTPIPCPVETKHSEPTVTVKRKVTAARGEASYSRDKSVPLQNAAAPVEITPSHVRQSRMARGLALTYFPLESVEGLTLLPARMAVLHDRPDPQNDGPPCGREQKGFQCAVLRNGRVLIVMPCYNDQGEEESDCRTQMRKQFTGKN